MNPDIRLIATDLDGTLIGSVNEFPLYKDFREVVNRLRATNGAVWVACTGRSRSSFQEFFSPMRTMAVEPDFIIVKHAYIYSLSRRGYMPHVGWNLSIRYAIWRAQAGTESAIREWHSLITGAAMGVRTVRLNRGRMHLRFDSEESAHVAADMLRERVQRFRHLRLFEYLREVDVRPVPYTKGLAVSELARHLGITRAQILAVGNGHNDISMLDGVVAGMTGCPANSDAEVMDVVHHSGGHIARERSLRGVMEILDAYATGAVCSDLPPDWEPPASQPSPVPPKRRHGRSSRINYKKLWWGVGIFYAVLMVLASFRMVPYSAVIMKPFDWVLSIVTRVLRLVWE